MANITLSNNAEATGKYLNVDGTVLQTQTAVEVIIAADLEITMTASKSIWADFEPNVYTVTITNNDDSNPFDPGDVGYILFETDTFPAASVTIDDSSVIVTGNTKLNASVASGVLSVQLSDPIVNGTDTVITFEVNRVVTP